MNERLSVITNPLPDPPYGADVSANGWKPEFHIDRIASSDTWTMAEDDERPWLLRIWMEAWRSIPAGSMPSDRRLFSRRIGCPKAFLDAHAEVFLRGWTLHSDGLLYHQFITSQVLSMLSTRRRSAEKVSAWRDRKAKEKQEKSGGETKTVTGYKPVTEVPVTSYQPVGNRQEQEQEQEQEKILIPGSSVEGGMGETENPPSAAPTPAASPPRVAKAERLCPLPDDLAITPELEAWADKRGYREPLAPHLESFREKAEMRGYRYAGRKGWTLALQKAIREDWAGLRTPRPQAHAPPASRARQIEDANRAHMRALGIDQPDAIEGVFHREH